MQNGLVLIDLFWFGVFWMVDDVISDVYDVKLSQYIRLLCAGIKGSSYFASEVPRFGLYGI